MKITIKRISRKKGTYVNKKGDEKDWERISVLDGSTWYSTFRSAWQANAFILDTWKEGMVLDVEVQKDDKGYWQIQPQQEPSAPVPVGLDMQRDLAEEINGLRDLMISMQTDLIKVLGLLEPKGEL